MEQSVHLQESFTVQTDCISFEVQEPPSLRRWQGRGQSVANKEAKLFLKLGATNLTQLELED